MTQFIIQKALAVSTLRDVLPANATNLTSILTFSNSLVGIALDIIGIVAVIMIIYSAFIYVTAYGDDSKAETAKKTLFWSIIGLVTVALAYALVHFGANLIDNAK